jgi:acetyltransferase-like isoleucine patch superfamily enzyme
MIRKKRLPLAHLVAFGWMPSPLKRLAYRLVLGYRIGRGVKFSFGGVVIGEDVELADHVEIGLLAIVTGRRIRIGRHSSVGTMSYVACERIEIGEDAKIREQVYVGGPQLPESAFILGSRTIVLQMAFINPTKPVTIGDDTGIGGHCLIFTHGAWLNALDGYPVNYEPVTLGKSVWLPWRVFLMPGTTIGDGTVIGANSLVSGTIPPNSLAVGSPAKVIRSAPDFPKKVSEEERKRIVAEMLSEFDRYVTYERTTISRDGALYTYRSRAGAWRLYRHDEGTTLPALRSSDTVFTDVELTADQQRDLKTRGVHWLDVRGKTRSESGSPLTEELAGFISRYGIRLPRV